LLKEIQTNVLPSWLKQLEKRVIPNYADERRNEKYLEILEADYRHGQAYSSSSPSSLSLPFAEAALMQFRLSSPSTPEELLAEAAYMFLRVFKKSMSNDYELLLDLLDNVLACMHIASHHLQLIISGIVQLYERSGSSLQLHTLILVNSLKLMLLMLSKLP
uniref:Protein SDA1 n=1 Tax=Gongylonema pulchrum TaxID=637853 RepID=A0A183D0A5_9BILA